MNIKKNSSSSTTFKLKLTPAIIHDVLTFFCVCVHLLSLFIVFVFLIDFRETSKCRKGVQQVCD